MVREIADVRINRSNMRIYNSMATETPKIRKRLKGECPFRYTKECGHRRRDSHTCGVHWHFKCTRTSVHARGGSREKAGSTGSLTEQPESRVWKLHGAVKRCMDNAVSLSTSCPVTRE